MNKDEIEGIVFTLAEQPMDEAIATRPRGITASQLATTTGVSKEWARRTLQRLMAEGRLMRRTYGQVHVYYRSGRE